jgi:hypothetical protein
MDSTLTLAGFGRLVADLGTIGLLTAIVYGSLRGWWVSGALHREIVAERDSRITELRSERDSFRDRLFMALEAASKATTVAERTTRREDREHPV